MDVATSLSKQLGQLRPASVELTVIVVDCILTLLTFALIDRMYLLREVVFFMFPPQGTEGR